MATAVLRSLDPLKDRLHLDAFGSRTPPPPMRSSRRKQHRSSPSSSPPARIHPPTRKPARSPPKPDARRVSFADKASPAVAKLPSRDLVMEEVTILKRGGEIRPSTATSRPSERTCVVEDVFSPLFSTNRLGPEPEILPKQIGFENSRQLYAGPAYSASPAPSSLPFPAAFLKKAGMDVATKNLRCLLRIDVLP